MSEDGRSSERASRAGTTARALGSGPRSFWDWFTDLGLGAWLLGLAGIVGVALVVAVIQGRSGPEESACAQAMPSVDVLVRTPSHAPLTAVQVQALHNASSQLSGVAGTALGDDKRAITDVAQLAGSAAAGRRFEAARTLDEFDEACPSGGFGG